VVAAALTVLALVALSSDLSRAVAGGGTAKPPPGAVAPFVTPTLPDPPLAVDPTRIHGFDDTGFIQAASVAPDNAMCPHTSDPHRFGGSVVLNDLTVVVPCNMVIQLPANTMTWADFLQGGPDLSLGHGYPSYQIHVIGNIVGSDRIAGLMYASQHAANAGTGVVSGIDYSTGDLLVDTGDAAHPTIVRINDPNGRFGRAQSPDPRFSVDDANPTVHASTGYPMCVPRTDPAVGDDPLCPQANRPRPVSGSCRNFSMAGVTPPKGGELTRPVAGQAFCAQFVMNTASARAAGDPDPRQQAPFEVGDVIRFSGSLMHPGVGSDYISAHTVEADLGIYTQPGTQPSYLAIGDFGVGSADPNPLSINGVTAESQDRIFLEAETTDVKTPVDIYLMDVDPLTGSVRNRWVTPFEMTGEQNGPVGADGVTPIGGGITTQNVGAQPQRVRLRATKAPAGLLSQPSRTVRVAARSLCTPQAPVNDPQGRPVLTALDRCLNNADAAARVANGLLAGQYFAPTFEFLFPENVKVGDLLVPYDFWHLAFLRLGEGAITPSSVGPGVGPLEPAPWGPTETVPGAPTIGTATAGDTSATVTWAPPISDGGSPITGYTVIAVDATGAVAATALTDAGPTSLTVTGLTNGDSYRLRVAAGNAVGTGMSSDLSNAVIPTAPLSAPLAPVIGTATARVGSVSITWNAPRSDGGSPITGYTVTTVRAGTGTLVSHTFAASSRSAIVSGLFNGVGYRVRVTARNSVGASPASALSNLVTTPSIPGAARITSAHPGVTTDGARISATASWLPPVSAGGTPITGYRVTAFRFSGARLVYRGVWARTLPSAARSLTFSGLVPRGTYRFRVQAVNAVGVGPASAYSNLVTAR